MHTQTVKSVKIMTVKKCRNPPIWQAFYCHKLGNLGAVLGTVLMEVENVSVAEFFVSYLIFFLNTRQFTLPRNPKGRVSQL